MVVEFILACHVITRDHMIKFGSHQDCGSGDMFLVAEEEGSFQMLFSIRHFTVY